MSNEEKEKEAEVLMTRARGKMIFKLPFYASLVLRLKLQPDWSHNTAYTNGKVIGYNPAWILSLPSINEVIGLLCHEVSHVAYMHPFRIGKRQHDKYNVAGDHVINNILTMSGLSIPEGGLCDIQYAHMSTEKVYELLPDQPEQESGGGGGHIGEVLPYPGDGDENEDNGNGPGMATDSELTHMEQEWTINLKQAVETAKQAGNCPAHLEKMVEEITDSSMPWQELLRNFMTSQAKNDFSWVRPNRRFVHMGIYLPSAYSEELGSVAFVTDTSGSISKSEKDLFIAELNSIVEDTQPACVHAMYVDTQVQQVDTIERDDYPITLREIHGGGTTFEPPFVWLEEHGIVPDCLIYMTDGYPNHKCVMAEPPYPVLWVCTSPAQDFASFGKVIYFKP